MTQTTTAPAGDRGADESATTTGPAEAAPAAAEPRDDLAVTRHEITVDGVPLRYTVTTGRLVLRAERGGGDAEFEGHKATAEVFTVAYTVDGAGPERPVTFAFNGGPGSSSVWLHLGLLGPRRVLMGDAGALLPPPYGLADNAQTLLRHSDLVFIDPVSTGFSRAVTGGKPADFHGFTADVESVGEVIRLWTTRNGRWMSPKYLCGESYGTTRAAALSRHLQEKYGLYLNGLMLLSSYLDGGSGEFSPGNDSVYAYYLPTYAAIAHYHGLHGDRPLRAVLDEAEAYAERDYLWALHRGSRLTGPERAAAVARVAALTGLTEDYVDRVDLRPEHIRFFTELLRSRRQTVGRLDGRFTGWDADYGARALVLRPVDRRHQRPVRRRPQPLRAGRAGVPQRPALRAADDGRAAVVLQGVRGRPPVRGRQAGRGHAGQPAHAGARGLRLPRRGHALLRRRAHLRAPGHPGRAARQRGVPLLRGRPHDVRARAEPAGAVGPAGRVRHGGIPAAAGG